MTPGTASPGSRTVSRLLELNSELTLAGQGREKKIQDNDPGLYQELNGASASMKAKVNRQF